MIVWSTVDHETWNFSSGRDTSSRYNDGDDAMMCISTLTQYSILYTVEIVVTYDDSYITNVVY